jgi:hypothetical protein
VGRRPGPFQQRDPATRTDAAGADHLAGCIREPETVEEMADVIREARPVPLEQRLHPVDVVIASDMTHQRELVDDPATTVDDGGELAHGL